MEMPTCLLLLCIGLVVSITQSMLPLSKQLHYIYIQWTKQIMNWHDWIKLPSNQSVSSVNLIRKISTQPAFVLHYINTLDKRYSYNNQIAYSETILIHWIYQYTVK